MCRYRLVPLERMGLHPEESEYDDKTERIRKYNLKPVGKKIKIHQFIIIGIISFDAKFTCILTMYLLCFLYIFLFGFLHV